MGETTNYGTTNWLFNISKKEELNNNRQANISIFEVLLCSEFVSPNTLDKEDSTCHIIM